MQINNIVIVGGGSSGWMTAAALSEVCPNVKVTLVESPNIPIIGVGESTLGHLNRYLGMLGIKDEDWMVPCNATYKNSIRFTNFREKDGTSFEYPFVSHYDFTDKPRRLETWSELATKYPDTFTPDTFAEMFAPAQTYLSKYNRQTHNLDNKLRNYDFNYDTAYHMDATLFGLWLKENVAIPNGINHILANIQNFSKDERGNISTITCDTGEVLTADLWIDCTGFKSQILEKWMGSEFVSFEKTLPTNKAWATHFPYKDRKTEMLNVTNCTALGNGWAWHICLWNRMGMGYVFSDKFISDEDALKEFKEYLKSIDPERAEKVNPRLVEIRHGSRKKAWLGNVVGIGLSYGFVEPLESSGLLTTHENIIRLVEVLNRRTGWVTRTEIEAYNYAAEQELYYFRDFICLHYALSKRDDTDFWRWCTEEHEFKPHLHSSNYQLKDSEGLFRDVLNPITLYNSFNEPNAGSNFIVAGMGIKSVNTKELFREHYKQVKARSTEKVLEEDDLETAAKSFFEHRREITDYVKTLPTQYEFLLKHIYKEDNY